MIITGGLTTSVPGESLTDESPVLSKEVIADIRESYETLFHPLKKGPEEEISYGPKEAE